MDLSAVLKSKYLLYGAGGLGTTAVGAIGVKAAVGGSSYSPEMSPLNGFEKIFRTDKIGTDVSQNIFDIRPGGCFSRFFPGVQYPSLSTFTEGTGTLPDSSKIDLSGHPIGCGLIKYSYDKKRFVYRSEFTVKNEHYGFSLFTGATNLKEKGRNYLEFWLTILKKEASSWRILEKRKWSRVSPPENDQSNKHFKTVNNMGLDPTSFVIDMKNASDDELDPTKYSPTNEKSISGFWLTAPDDEPDNKFYMFEEGSTEKWGLKEHLGKTTTAPVKSIFLQNSKLSDKKGRWVRQESHCRWVIENDKHNPNSTTESNRHLRYNGLI